MSKLSFTLYFGFRVSAISWSVQNKCFFNVSIADVVGNKSVYSSMTSISKKRSL